MTALDNGAGGAIVDVAGITHIMVCGEAGQKRTVQAAGHAVETDAEIAVISIKPAGPEAFMLRGTTVPLYGKPLKVQDVTWRVGGD